MFILVVEFHFRCQIKSVIRFNFVSEIKFMGGVNNKYIKSSWKNNN